MTINIEKLGESLEKIEKVVDTEWLEKWVHEIKELEFKAEPSKNYEEFMTKIPPMAVIWCKAQDEFTMMSLTGDFKLKKILFKAYEIGESLSKCENLPGLEKHIELLKSSDFYSFSEASYSLTVAAGYTELGYKPILGNPLILDYNGTPVQVFCRVPKRLTSKDLELYKFWYILAGELGRRLTFFNLSRSVLITAREFPKLEDVTSILKEISSSITASKNRKVITLDINSKYIVQIKTTGEISQPEDKLIAACNYEFMTVIGSSVAAFNLLEGSDREEEIINICNRDNALADKKIPTILYVDISVGQARQQYVPIKYYNEQIKTKHISNYENLSRIILSACLSETSKTGVNHCNIGNSINNNYASIQLPGEFVAYI